MLRCRVLFVSLRRRKFLIFQHFEKKELFFFPFTNYSLSLNNNSLSQLSVEMMLKPHTKFGIILLGILLLVYFLISCNKFRLNRTVGILLFLLYFVFISYSLVQELVCDGGARC